MHNESQAKTAQVFRAKYVLEYDSEPYETETETGTQTLLTVEAADGTTKTFKGYEAETVKGVLDSLGLYYMAKSVPVENATRKKAKKYVQALKDLRAGLTVPDTDLQCHGGGQYSREIILETPTTFGAGQHLARRRDLESFFKEHGVEGFTVECFTVHSDSVCRMA